MINMFARKLNLFRPDMEEVRAAFERSDRSAWESLLLDRWRRTLGQGNSANTLMSEEESRIAALLLNNELSLLNSEPFALGKPTDWTQFSDKHPQLTSHLGYMYWLVPLGKAYAQSSDEIYAEKMLELINSFLTELPYGTKKLNWYPSYAAWERAWGTCNNGESSNQSGQWHSLSCHSRIDKWLLALSFIARSRLLTFDTLWRILDSLMTEHAQLIVANPRENTPNQYLSNSISLLRLGLMFPEFRVANSYFEIGWNRFRNAIRTTVLPDASCVERSLNYNNNLPGVILQVRDLLAGASPEYLNSLQSLGASVSLLLSRLTTPDGKNLQIAKTHPHRMESLIRRWGDGFGLAECLRLAGDTLPEPSIQPDFYLPYGGYCVLQSDWSSRAFQLFFKNSGLSPGHMHEDCLNLTLSQYGKAVLVEAGNYNYNDTTDLDRSMSRYCEGSAGHNSITVDGTGQRRKLIRHQTDRDMHQAPDWGAYHKRLPFRATKGEFFTFVEGSYDDGFGDSKLEIPVAHSRMVVWVKQVGVLVIDELTPCDAKTHCYEQHWHLDSAFNRELISFDQARGVLQAGSDSLQLQMTTAVFADFDLVFGQDHPSRGWHCYEYDKRQPNADIIFRMEGAGRQCLVTLIRTFEGGCPPPMYPKQIQEAGRLKRVDFGNSDGGMLSCENSGKEWLIALVESGQEVCALRIPRDRSLLPTELQPGTSSVMVSLAVDEDPDLANYFKLNDLKHALSEA